MTTKEQQIRYVREVRLPQVREKLRPYQAEGVDIMDKRTRWLECDDMGLGKTVTCLTSFLTRTDWQHSRALILCGTNAMGVWNEELRKWFGIRALNYHGTPAQRKKIWANFERDEGIKFLITTYAMLKELPKGWDGLFADEYHMFGIMNHKTQTSKLLEQHMPSFKYVYLITGTPIRQGVIDLYNPLHLMDPGKFKNYWSFVNRYCITIQTPFGKSIERNPKNIPEFREMLNQYMVRRMKVDVLKDLPGKQRNVVPVEMTAKQAAAYEALKNDMIYEGAEDESPIIAPNQMVVDLRLRQLLVCPRLLGIDDDGAGFAYLSEVVPNLLLAGRPVCFFTPFREAIPLMEDLIKGWGLGTDVYVLQGGMTPIAFAMQWQTFQSTANKNKVMLCVIKSAASYDAYEAADGFFLGYEWDFNLNVQGEDRMCRLGQQNFVNCNYILHVGDTVDDLVKEKLNEKQMAADWIIGSREVYEAMWKKVRKTRDE
jgi:SNF2 family DNA or RNA helicase